jgi:hypothetical protein
MTSGRGDRKGCSVGPYIITSQATIVCEAPGLLVIFPAGANTCLLDKNSKAAPTHRAPRQTEYRSMARSAARRLPIARE